MCGSSQDTLRRSWCTDALDDSIQLDSISLVSTTRFSAYPHRINGYLLLSHGKSYSPLHLIQAKNFISVSNNPKAAKPHPVATSVQDNFKNHTSPA